MSTPPSFGEWALAFVAEVLAKANASKPEEELDDEFDIESEGPGADDIVAMRQEWGYRLLAEQAKVEELERERDAALLAQEEAYKQLRIITIHLQKVFAAYQLLHEALYGVG